jgi:hypothetical protein
LGWISGAGVNRGDLLLQIQLARFEDCQLLFLFFVLVVLFFPRGVLSILRRTTPR